MKNLHKIKSVGFIILLLLSMPFAVYAVDGQIKIAQTSDTTFPIIISKPGSYVLTSNITVNTPNVHAIKIQADRVTLDLNGHVIDGPNQGTGYGIYATNCYNVTIKNGTIIEFNYGVFIHNGNADGGGHLIQGIKAQRNSAYGISVEWATLTDCIAENNGFGIEAYSSNVRYCSASFNNVIGIRATNGTVIGCRANTNGGTGIFVTQCVITDCTAHNNSSDGINGSGSISNCTSVSNSGDGIDFEGTVTNCVVLNNSYCGIRAYKSIVVDCLASGNKDDGIAVSGSIVRSCNAQNNGNSSSDYGIKTRYDYQLRNSYIYGNTSRYNYNNQDYFCNFGTCEDNI